MTKPKLEEEGIRVAEPEQSGVGIHTGIEHRDDLGWRVRTSESEGGLHEVSKQDEGLV